MTHQRTAAGDFAAPASNPASNQASNAPPTLALCMIVKNEAAVLADCLASVRSIVDEINLVDTGSQDDTIEIGRRFGARIRAMAWPDDFSIARNASLAMATTDWILVLDADEVVAERDLQTLQQLITKTTRAGFALEQKTYGNNPNFVNWQRCREQLPEAKGNVGYVVSPLVRLFRNDPRIRFEGQVHEVVEPSFSRAGLTYRSVSVPIHHYGKVLEAERIQRKARLYRQLGEKKSRDCPDDPKVHSDLGAQYLELGRYRQAVQAFKKCIALDPSNSQAHANLGVSYLRAGDLERAYTALNTALAQTPADLDARFNLGAVYLHMQRYGQAERCFRECLDRDPAYGLAYGAMGMALLSTNRLGQALCYLLRAATLNPGDADIFSNLAWGCERLDWVWQSAAYCRKALELVPNHPNALKIEHKMRNRTKFRPDSQSATQLTVQGERRWDRGDYRAARIDFEKALAQNPYHRSAWNNLGVWHWQTGDEKQAFEHLLCAWLLDPRDPDVQANLADLEQKPDRKALCHLMHALGSRFKPFGTNLGIPSVTNTETESAAPDAALQTTEFAADHTTVSGIPARGGY